MCGKQNDRIVNAVLGDVVLYELNVIYKKREENAQKKKSWVVEQKNLLHRIAKF